MKSQILVAALGFISSATAAPSASIEARVAGAPIGYGAGTTGGAGGTTTTVKDCAALIAATDKKLTTKRIVYIDGLLSGCGIVDVGSNVSIFGKGTGSGVTDSGFRVRKGTNVIFQNLALGPAPPKGDILAIDESTQIWVDHNTFTSKGLVGGKDDYDGLLDITHAADMVTVSWNKFSGHWKGSLVGHSDNNAAEDTGKLHVTYHHNQFDKVNSRLPSVRFGTAHVFNSHITGTDTSGINSRMGAQVYVEANVFDNTNLAMVTDLDSKLPGSICDVNNLLTGTSTTRITQKCTLKIPYSYTAESASTVAASVANGAGVGKVSP
ncbi:putative pectate lyase B [Leptodontidium sp. 2 PMI_412]|nr:putative pectate lyase B [Leptodontidium sp. MPI-SDFR-AT-0119]KAH9223344.1 putative pectate lyase B [Leptodontidium sp. 2 PMI_412]